MNNNTNPIELFIVALLLLVEGICWIINELAGFHTTTTEIEIEDPRDTIAIEASVPEVDVDPDLFTLTVKELRKQAKGLAKGIHQMKKAELVDLLLAA